MNAQAALKPVVLFLVILISGIGVAQGWMTTQRSYEMRARLPIDPPRACQSDDAEQGHDSCKETLAGRFSALPVVGVPVAAVGTGVHTVAFIAALWLAVGLFLSSRRQERWSMAALSAAAAIALTGTVLYLGMTVALWTWCGLCMRMHLMSALLALSVGGLALFSSGLYSGKPKTNRWAVAMMVLLAVLVWAGVSKGVDLLFSARYNAIAKDHIKATPAYNDLIAECRTGACVEPLVFDTSAMPREYESLVLSDVEGPVLVEMLDMSCPHCARTHKEFLSQWYRNIAEDKPFGLRLVLWPSGQGCNPDVKRYRPASCKANTALLCAFREASGGQGPQKALNYMDAEFALPTRQAPFPGGREAWLRDNVSERAARCYREELDKGTRGTLKKHVAAWKRLRRAAKKHKGCGGSSSEDAWWCFQATPSFAVVSKEPPKNTTNKKARIEETKKAVDRQQLLDLRDCLQP